MTLNATRRTLKSNSAKFFAEEYGTARPLYPRSVFDLLLRHSSSLRARRSDGTPQRFLDLGCGTGQSTRSFLDLGLFTEGVGVEPDPEMLAHAQSALAPEFPELDLLSGSAESIPLPDASVDLVLIGSAIHWFDLETAVAELKRVLHPEGLLYVFEYQFPVAEHDPDLNEKIRRRFNLEWKAPLQKPRGRLIDVLEPFRQPPEWNFLGADRPEWKVPLSLDVFLGHVFSQSRYLHAESIQPDPAEYRKTVRAEIAPHFADGPLFCDFRARSHLLRAPGASGKR